METHLSALSSALDAIHDLHTRTACGRRARSSGSGVFVESGASLPTLGREHFPFTKAVLNPDGKDILDFIRDANHLEASLFWYPPSSTEEENAAAPGNAGGRKRGAAGAGTGASGAGRAGEELPAGALDVQLSVTRAPALRQAVPPTPLKASSKDLESAGLLVWDSRTLLLTAQRLAAGSAGDAKFVRTRKLIKDLLRRAADVERSRARFEARAAAMDEAIRLGPEGHKRKVEDAKRQAEKERASRNAPTQALLAKVKQLKQELQQEEMEVFALEEMKSELAEKQKKQQAAKSADNDTTITSESADDLAASIAGDGSQEFIGDTSVPSALRGGSRAAASKAGGRKSTLAESTTATDDADADAEEDVTIRHDAPGEAGAADSQADTSGVGAADSSALLSSSGADEEDDDDAIPDATDELERVTEKIWAVFGDVVRFVAPDRESADFAETLKMLEALIGARSPASPAGGGSGAAGAAAGGGDTSVASSALTGTTASSTASSTSGALPNAGPPGPTNLAAAHVLIALLRTPEPHQLEFEDLKILTGTWWEGAGGRARCTQLAAEQRALADAPEIDSPGETLAARAIYGLQAKKLLIIRRKGAKAPVGFAGL